MVQRFSSLKNGQNTWSEDEHRVEFSLTQWRCAILPWRDSEARIFDVN